MNFSDQDPTLGGVILNNDGTQLTMQVLANQEEFGEKSAEISNRAYFASLKPLIRVISMPHAIEKALDDKELRLDGEAAFWLKGLFSGIPWDLYDLDHF